LALIGEVLHILRPFIYYYFIRTYNHSHTTTTTTTTTSTKRRSPWFPFLLSLLLDIAAHKCTKMGHDFTKLDNLQKMEVERRRRLWVLYLLRSPLFQLLTSPMVGGVERRLRSLPLLGGMSSYALQMLKYIHQHYFYISGS